MSHCGRLVQQLRSFHLYKSSRLFKNVAFNLSDIGEGIREVNVKEWYVKEGDKVAQFDNICEVQSDKASVTITSRYDGVITKLHYKIDEVALVGKPLVDIETDEGEETIEEQTKEETIEEQTKEEAVVETKEINNYALCIPSVRRLAKEYKINLQEITGTGKSGRILKEDVLKFLEKTKTTQTVSSEDKIEPVTGFSKAMVRTMTESLKIPHFVYSDEIKMTNLTKLRQSLKVEQNIKLTFMPFLIKAASNALNRYPIINSSLDEACENVIYKKQHNIGVAMDTKIGLAVPVIKNVQDLDIIQISEELARLLKSGKSGSISREDLTGATFSISNIGIIGGTYMKPVIASPQVAIVAVGASQILPRFDADRNVIAEEIANISASGDHRIVDGATMANFIKTFKRQIENPNLLFLNL